ncbi:FusB/FusC family EF-G-binding protein [Niallia circulans]|uniref:Elongation factor G-binding protein n=1 Tax=Niallia circulans TaxID=1397 RepID=A0A941GLB0_NIACI|nr:elongation factor G-binding protein [Niallia circulans]EOR25823.1 fibronectin-binding family protein [Niallia nealsonii AAU1]MCB5239962.1 elongation factor G-binding protein [Niallia circulans]
MTEQFIKNEQLNFIEKQIAIIKDSSNKNLPKTVLTAVIDLANAKILDLFPQASLEQQELLDITKWHTKEEYERYIEQLTACLLPFPKITEQQLKKLFPKQKKLRLPDLSTIDHNKLTFLSWNDLKSNKKVIIYDLEGTLVGTEGKMTPTSKKNICSFCNCFGEVAYFSTVTKEKRPKNADYYKAIGNLICTDSNECNKNITNTEYLREFLKTAEGRFY